jgi:hypothetical protein
LSGPSERFGTALGTVRSLPSPFGKSNCSSAKERAGTRNNRNAAVRTQTLLMIPSLNNYSSTGRQLQPLLYLALNDVPLSIYDDYDNKGKDTP